MATFESLPPVDGIWYLVRQSWVECYFDAHPHDSVRVQRAMTRIENEDNGELGIISMRFLFGQEYEDPDHVLNFIRTLFGEQAEDDRFIGNNATFL